MKTVNNLMLYYHRDPSSGVPNLSIERGSLPLAEIKALESELAGQYEQLSRKSDCETVTLQGRPFQLKVLRRETRMPELVLEQPAAENGVSALSLRTEALSWTDGFLSAVEPLVSQAPDPRDPHAHARVALCFTLDELRALGRVSPDWLALLLTTGYLIFHKECCQEQDPSLGNFYGLALGELERLLETRVAEDPSLLGDGKLDLRDRPALGTAGALGWLKRSFHVLFPGQS